MISIFVCELSSRLSGWWPDWGWEIFHEKEGSVARPSGEDKYFYSSQMFKGLSASTAAMAKSKLGLNKSIQKQLRKK